LYQLQQKKSIPAIPIFLDSPMAISVTQLFCTFKDDYTLPVSLCKEILGVATPTPTVEDSKRLDHLNGPAIIIAGSGMLGGGRMMHHLPTYISDPKNTVLLVGYQAEGGQGYNLVKGANELHLFGQTYQVQAEIKIINLFSAHADYNEILESLKKKIEDRFGWLVIIPKYQESFDLN
jgi:metallo-beta-lactamase family protein